MDTGRVLVWPRRSSLLLAMGALGVGFFYRAALPSLQAVLGAGVLLWGAVWVLGQARRWRWVSTPGLILFCLAAAAGVWLGLPFGWFLAGTVLALVTWDLDHFARRLSRAARIEDRRAFERRHLLRLAWVAGLGALLAAAARLMQIQFTFGAALVLGLLAVLGISQALRYMRRQPG